MGDLGDIVNLASQVVKVLDSNEVQSMGNLATALPRGVDPLSTDGNWKRLDSPMLMTITWPAEYPTFSDDDVLNLGVIWTYGGSVHGEGRFIKDAEAFVTVGHISSTYTYNVAAKFADSGTPIGPGPTAMLTGTFNVRVSRWITGAEPSLMIGFTILGDGSGSMKRLA
jgi:hypothetical protein